MIEQGSWDFIFNHVGVALRGSGQLLPSIWCCREASKQTLPLKLPQHVVQLAPFQRHLVAVQFLQADCHTLQTQMQPGNGWLQGRVLQELHQQAHG